MKHTILMTAVLWLLSIKCVQAITFIPIKLPTATPTPKFFPIKNLQLIPTAAPTIKLVPIKNLGSIKLVPTLATKMTPTITPESTVEPTAETTIAAPTSNIQTPPTEAPAKTTGNTSQSTDMTVYFLLATIVLLGAIILVQVWPRKEDKKTNQ